MSTTTSIEWTQKTWNPLVGCTKVSPGCKNCYAMRMAQRLAAMALADIEAGRDPGRKGHYVNVVRYADPSPGAAGARQDPKPLPQWNGAVELVHDALTDPLHWRKPARVFVNSMSDLFHEDVPFDFVDRVMAIINATYIYPPRQGSSPHDVRHWHTYQILTKRPERMAEYVASRAVKHYRQGMHPILRVRGDVFRGQGSALMNSAAIVMLPPQNALFGVSIENQQEADKRREFMRAIADAGWQTWVSYEPALGPVDWTGWEFIRWMVSGGESGPDARPSHPNWHRATRDWCLANGVPFFFKQWGAWGAGSINVSTGDEVFRQFDNKQQWINKASTWVNGGSCVDAAGKVCSIGADFAAANYPVVIVHRHGKKAAGRLLDGREWNEMPVIGGAD